MNLYLLKGLISCVLIFSFSISFSEWKGKDKVCSDFIVMIRR